jgi:hypothetical protein
MASAIHFDTFGFSRPGPAREGRGPGAWRKSLASRLDDWFEAHRQRDAERLMARLLAQSGGRLTDSMEREIALKLFEPSGFGPQ